MGLNYAGLWSFSGSNPSSPPPITTGGPYTGTNGPDAMESQPNTNYLWVINKNGSGYQFDLSNLTQVKIYNIGNGANNGGLAFPVVNGLASAVIACTANSQKGNIIEVSSGYQTQVTNAGATGTILYAAPQQMAACASGWATGAVWATANTTFAGSLNAWASGTGQFYPQTMDWLKNDFACSIIAIPNGNFLVGTMYGYIHEMDVFGNPVSKWAISRVDTYESTDLIVDASPSIITMLWYDNLVLATDTHGNLHKVHWPTKQTVTTDWFGQGQNGGSQSSIGSFTGTILGMTLAGASGFMMCPDYYVNGTNNLITSSDWMQTPIRPETQGIFILNGYTTTPGVPLWAAYNANTQRYAYYQNGSNFLFVLNFIPDANRTEVNSSLFDGGVYQQGRVMRLMDAGGSGATMLLDAPTDAVSSNPYPAPTGKTIIEFAVYGEGVNEKGSLSIYNT